MPRRLTQKQKNFSHAFVKSANQTKAALASYETTNIDSAKVIGSINMQNPRIVTYIDSLLSNAGITDQYLAQHAKQILDASITKQSLKKIKPADGVRMSEMAHRLKDHFPAQRTQIDKREVSLKLKGKSPKELQEALISIKEELNTFSKLINKDPQIPQEVFNTSLQGSEGEGVSE